ncbi:hypothetical protein HDU84_002006 [Entophlyctis sp. JEL0112]|nr:hypothetical protein HDU84_002006 [Entophlyctis sp. JEL0112]
MQPVEFIFVGTGTSSGIPNVTCLTHRPSPVCEVCLLAAQWTEPSTAFLNAKRSPALVAPPPAWNRNRRGNTSGLYRYGHSDGRIRNILIDVGKFFRESALAWFSYYDIESIDAILVTHGHADAMLGFDDLRQWTMDAKVHASIPVYLNVATMAVVATTFPYLVDASLATGGGQVPSLEFVVFEKDASTNEYNSIDIEELRVIPFDVEHGTAGDQPYYSLGFKFPGITYISDTNRIPETAMSLIQDSDVLVLDGLRESEHSSHFSVTQAIQHALILKPRLFYITDFCHDVEHSKVEERLRLHPELNEAG